MSWPSNNSFLVFRACGSNKAFYVRVCVRMCLSVWPVCSVLTKVISTSRPESTPTSPTEPPSTTSSTLGHAERNSPFGHREHGNYNQMACSTQTMTPSPHQNSLFTPGVSGHMQIPAPFMTSTPVSESFVRSDTEQGEQPDHRWPFYANHPAGMILLQQHYARPDCYSYNSIMHAQIATLTTAALCMPSFVRAVIYARDM